jgi:predicted ArsR family transcriptional regulator
LHDYFSRNMQAKELNRAVTVLANDGLIRVVRGRGEKGRPAERYHADELEESE